MNTSLLTVLADHLELLHPEKFDIESWQYDPYGVEVRVANNAEEFHQCGNTACIAGYASLIPAWQDAGMFPGGSGLPITYAKVQLNPTDEYTEVMLTGGLCFCRNCQTPG